METNKINYETILRICATFRIVPMLWFNSTENKEIKSRLNIVLNNLKNNKLITIVKDQVVGNYLALSNKGYNSINIKYPIYWQYEGFYDNPSSNRSSTISTKRHTYLFYQFLFKYLISHDQPNYILTDYDEECALTVKTFSNNYQILPDGIIRASEDAKNSKIIAFEGDTGSEKVKFIFEKIFNYLLYCSQDFNGDDVKSLDLYFCFRTQSRQQTLFNKNNGLIWNHFDQGSSIRYEDTTKKINNSMSLSSFIKTVKNQKFRLFIGNQGSGIEEYQSIDLMEMILNNCHNTKEYIENILNGKTQEDDQIEKQQTQTVLTEHLNFDL
jgi:hypothetical protein